MLAPRKRLTGAVALAVVASGLSLLPLAPASANPAGTGLVISEVYGAGGLAASGDLPASSYANDFIELYNPTGSPVDLSTWAVFYGSATRASGANLSNKTNLTGSIPAHGHYLVAESGTAGNGAALPTADVTGSLSMSGTSGLVILSNQQATLTPPTGSITNATGVVDAVGYGTANTFEGAAQGTGLGGTTSANRVAAGTDTDGNAADFSVAAPTPTSSGPATPAALAVTDPGDKTAFVGTAITPIALAATGGTAPYTWAATGLPEGLSLAGSTISGTPTTAGAAEVTLTATDSATPAATDTETFTITVGAAPAVHTIADIQGTGATSPLAGSTVTTRGVVTATYPTGGLNGFYLQTDGTGGAADATPGASDAVFVYGGATGFATYPAVNDLVDVTGVVSEFAGTTEITPGSGGVVAASGTPTGVTPLAIAYPTSEAGREAHEGELLAPTNHLTVTNTYSTNQYAEIGLATGDRPLIQPTDVARPGSARAGAVAADNAARGVVLDDASSLNFLSAANQGTPLPWLSTTNPIRVGARATLHAPVILEYRNNVWKFQPQTRVTDEGAVVATFEKTRTQAPEFVPGDLHIATFNVLNYFNTTGEAWVGAGAGRTCTYYSDRAGNRVSDNTCNPASTETTLGGPRGAAQDDDLARQQAKIVAAINALGADIVSLEEIENSVKLGESNRDDALKTLVSALNAAAGSQRWAYAPSPTAAELPALAEQDVIRTAFIYNPATVSRVGASKVLVGSAPFANAREPLGQAFKAKDVPNTTFAVVVNHLKSKGDSTPAQSGNDNADTGDGQGAYNGDRTRQAAALTGFANDFASSRGTDRVFLTGDFNSYTKEDPMQVLYDAGYTAIESDTLGESTYSFSGLSGSLDHVLANKAALNLVTGADIWNINSGESVAFEYSRNNYNATDFYQANMFRASDHDPEIVGIDLPRTDPSKVLLNLLGVNDFHGRINANTVKWAGTVEQLTDEGSADSTLLVGAGDLIGASEFASSVAEDQPTIDMFNALGLDASAVGNHEFDKGWADLRDRVIGADGSRNAKWDYLGANVYKKGTEDPVLPEYATFDVDGVTVGVIGAVTEETSTLVSPGGIKDIEFGDPVVAVNRVARELSDGAAANGEADVIVASFHAGATQGIGSNYAAEVARGGEFGAMANLDPAVNVIFNGHTHQAYAWDAPIPGAPGKTRPIIQTGSYGDYVGQVKLTIDKATGAVSAYTVRNVARTTQDDADLVAQYPKVGQVKTIVDAAIANAATVGNTPVGSITGDFSRAFKGGSYATGKYVATANSTNEDRGAESTLGELVGNALRDGIPADIGTADLGIVNPGGMRTELLYAGSTASNPANTDGVVTYAEANGVLPFVNNIWLIDLTGAELKEVMEQQWQTNPSGPTPARPYLQLGFSDNVHVTADATKPAGSRITSVLIDGKPLDPTATYTVSTFSFLGTGGDNFRAFTAGTSRDTGLVDRDLWISYLKSHPQLTPNSARQQVFETGMPAEVTPGQHVAFTLGTDLTDPTAPSTGETLDLTSLGSPLNTTLSVTGVRADHTEVDLGDVTVTNGTAAVAFDVPTGLGAGAVIRLTADPSGTTVTIPVTGAATPEPATATVSAGNVSVTYGKAATVNVKVTGIGAVPTGTVSVFDGSRKLGTGTLVGGTAKVTLPAKSLKPGSHSLTASYSGDAGFKPGTDRFTATVAKARSATKVTAHPATVRVKGSRVTLRIAVVGQSGVLPTGRVSVKVVGHAARTVTLRNGRATLKLARFNVAGRKTIRVTYLGNTYLKASSDTVVVRVVRR